MPLLRKTASNLKLVLKMPDTDCPGNPTIPLVGYIQANKNVDTKIHVQTFIATLLITAKRWQRPKCPTTCERISRTPQWHI